MNKHTNIEFASQEGEKAAASLCWKDYSNAERVRRGAVISIILLVIGFAIYLVPVVHLPIIAYWYVYIPALVLFSLFMGWRQYQRVYSLIGAEGDCPNCRHRVRIDLDNGDQVPLRKYCPQCDKPVDVLPGGSA